MVEMQTRLTGSMLADWRCWTLYNSVNLRRSSGVLKPWNSRRVWRAQVAAVDEEQHAARAGVLDEAVHLVARHEGLAAAGGHLHQRPGPPRREGIFQVRYGPRLNGPEAGRVQVRHLPQPVPQVGRRQVADGRFGNPPLAGRRHLVGVEPRGQRVRGVEGEYVSAARLGVEPVGELRLLAGALVQERQGATVRWKVVGQAGTVLLRLQLHAGERAANGLGLDHAGRLLVHVEQVVGLAVAGLQPELAHRHARRRVQVGGARVLNGPSRLLEQVVDGNERLFFGCHVSGAIGAAESRFLNNRIYPMFTDCRPGLPAIECT